MEKEISERLDESVSEEIFNNLLEINKKAPWSKYYEKKISSLLNKFPDKDERQLIIGLIERFHYMTGREYEESLEEISKIIAIHWKLSPKETVVVSKNLDGGTDSSNAVVQNIKHRFADYKGWKDSNFSANIRDCLKEEKFVNFVIVDDFTGTGNQVYSFCEWLSNEVATQERSNISLYVAFVAAMNPAVQRKYPEILKEFYADKKLNRGISDHFTEENLLEAEKFMSGIEDRYGVPEKYKFGYQRSEAIHYCETLGIPNNVFPAFWSRKMPFQIFKRL